MGIDRRCFVISPIGEEGSEVRAHADDVFDYIIKPAMEERGVVATRADHMSEPGRITDQMFRAITDADVCVALLTGHNPNVFYELAYAQCVRRPVIILILKGGVMPFDIRDLRCVQYDLSPRPLFDKVYVREIQAHLDTIQAAGWTATPPFDADMLSPGTEGFLERSLDFGNADDWLQLLLESEHVFDIMSVTLKRWKDCEDFGERLLAKAKAGCRIRILLLHEDNAALPALINPSLPTRALDSTKHTIQRMAQYYSEIAATHEAIEMRQMRRGVPFVHLARNDRLAVSVQNLFAVHYDYAPLWRWSRDSSQYEVVTKEFEALWGANAGPPPTP